jgi:hypothetical protein
VAREGDSFRFVPFSEHKGVKPLWAVTVTIYDTGDVRWETYYFLPGFFRRQSRWTYELTALRFDSAKDDKDGPFILPVEQVHQLRPLVIAELNRRNPAAHHGDQLEVLLTDGLAATSYVCAQNVLILLGWLSLPMALIGLGSMFIGHRPGESGTSKGLVSEA